jgi:hypothetical protein
MAFSGRLFFLQFVSLYFCWRFLYFSLPLMARYGDKLKKSANIEPRAASNIKQKGALTQLLTGYLSPGNPNAFLFSQTLKSWALVGEASWERGFGHCCGVCA